MTSYGTPGSTTLNISPFQGTTPGYTAVNGTLQLSIPGPGLFPPGSISVSNDTTLAAVSAARVPMNLQLNNALAGTGRQNALAERMSESGTNGSASTIGGGAIGAYHPMTNSANGGSSAGSGAGGMNQDIGGNSGRSDTLCGAMPAFLIGAANPPNFVG